jgi:hypothetical protein
MNKRLELQNILETLMGNRHVYYQPPENLKMEYPCIRYSKSDILSNHADNINYINKINYEIIVIDKNPDNVVIEKILELPLSSYDRHYVSDNLNHDVIRLYY